MRGMQTLRGVPDAENSTPLAFKDSVWAYRKTIGGDVKRHAVSRMCVWAGNVVQGGQLCQKLRVLCDCAGTSMNALPSGATQALVIASSVVFGRVKKGTS